MENILSYTLKTPLPVSLVAPSLKDKHKAHPGRNPVNSLPNSSKKPYTGLLKPRK